jgi:hypothetical protein
VVGVTAPTRVSEVGLLVFDVDATAVGRPATNCAWAPVVEPLWLLATIA